MKFISNKSCIIISVLVTFMACFVLSACEDHVASGIGCASLGWSSFRLDGVVLTTEGDPIQGIAVHANKCGPDNPAFSDLDGKWQFNDEQCGAQHGDETLVIAFDPDKTDNGGLFADWEQEVPVIQTEPDNEEECYYGEFSASDIVIVMELAQ